MAAKNFAISSVATAPSPATSGTSLVVASGEGARFPGVPFKATIWPSSATTTPANAEVVTVTARATDTLTIVRAQESSTARTVVVGDQIAATLTASMYDAPILTGPRPWADVRAYGATGDGTTDDTTALQAAINAANTAGGGVVYVPKGTYISLTLTLYANVWLRGDGLGASILKLKTGANADLLGSSSAANVHLSDLTLDGNRANQTGTSRCYMASLSDYSVMERVRFTGGRSFGLGLGGSKYYRAIGCRFDDCGNDPNAGDGLVWVGNNGATYSTDGVFDRCLFVGRAAGPEGVTITADRTTVANSFFIGNDTHQDASGFYIGAAVRDLRMANNHIEKCGNYGIDVDFSNTDATYGVVLEGNVIRECRNAAIGIASNGAVLAGNHCNNNGRTINATAPDAGSGVGILVDGANIVISGGRCTDTQGTKTQNYGIKCRNLSGVLSKLTVVGTDIEGNLSDGIAGLDIVTGTTIARGVRTQDDLGGSGYTETIAWGTD